MSPQEGLARALHETDDVCNANYYLPFEECATMGFDIERAEEVLDVLRRLGWRIEADPAGTIPIDAGAT